MTSPIDTIQQLAESAADAVDARTLALLPAAELVQLTGAIERLGRVADALRVATASAIDRRSNRWLGTAGLAQSYGYRRGSELIEQVTGVSSVTARRRIHLGESVCERDGSLGAILPALFPVVGAAFSAGQIGVDVARTITTELAQTDTRASANALRVAERLLVAQAAGRPQDVTDLTAANLSEAGLPESEPNGASDTDRCPGLMSADLVAVQAHLARRLGS